MKVRSREEIRDVLKSYAGTISGNCREMMRETAELAHFIEDMLDKPDRYDTSIEGMDSRYSRFGEAYMLFEEGKRYINAASGFVPVDEKVKRELRLYEHAKRKLGEAHRKLRYCDEMWIFTNESLASGWMDYEYIADTMPMLEKIDLTQLHALKLTRLGWFDIVNPVNDPERKGAWSPFPFIEMFGQWVYNYLFPIYTNNSFKGIMAPHANIEPMLEDSIYKSEEMMIAVHDDSTLMGMNAAASECLPLEAYKFRFWLEFPEKITRVRNELNLMKNTSDDIVWLADGLRWQNEFEHTIDGKTYTVIRERVPEIGMNLAALIAG